MPFGPLLETALLLSAGIGLFFVSGYALSALVAPAEGRLNRALLVPVLGFAVFLCFSHLLAALSLTGRQITFVSLPFLLASLLLSARRAPIRSKEWAEAVPVFIVAAAAVVLSSWPLLITGYRDYLALSSPDAAFHSAIFQNLLDLPFGTNPNEGFASVWPNPKPGAVLGVSYIATVLATLFRVDVLYLHQVLAGCFVFLAPVSAALLARSAFGASGWSSWAGAAAAALASHFVVMVNAQSLGAVAVAALTPAVLATWNEVARSGALRHFPAPALLTSALLFAYPPSMTALAALAAVSLAVGVWKRWITRPAAVAAVLLTGLIFFGCFPRVAAHITQTAIRETLATLVDAGAETATAFGFALTESYLPYFWGVGYPQWQPALFASFSPGLLCAYLAAFGLCALLLAAVWRSRDSAAVLTPLQFQLGFMLAVILAFQLRHNGDGLLKLTSWWSPVFCIAVATGAAQLIHHRNSCRTTRWAAIAAILILAVAGTLNARAGYDVARRSLFATPGAPPVTANFRLRDFVELRHVRQHLASTDKLLVVIDEGMVQDWALMALYRDNIAIKPLLISAGAPDERTLKGMRTAATDGWEAAQWMLTLRDPQFSAPPSAKAVWSNRAFVLYRMGELTNFAVFGERWYARERLIDAPFPWQKDFRWMRNNGEILIFNGSGTPLELRADIVPGPSSPPEGVDIIVWQDRRNLARLHFKPGVGTLRTPPFTASGPVTRLRLEVDDLPDPATTRPRSSVPVDHRQLTLAISKPVLQPVFASGAPTISDKILFPTSDRPPALSISGVYSDGWITPRAWVAIQACGSNPVIKVNGHLRGDPAIPVPFPWTVSVGGRVVPAAISKPGDFELSLPVSRKSAECAPVPIEINSEIVRHAPKGLNDSRPLALRLIAVKVEPGPKN